MATLATLWNRWAAVKETGELAAEAGARPAAGTGRLRPIPNEDVYLYVKRIDNTRVVRAADPRSGRTCWKVIGATGLLTLVLIGLFLPSVYGLLEGQNIEALKAEQSKILDERAVLELAEARLLDPARLQELARAQQFVEPASGRVIYLNPDADGALAMNVPGKNGE
jgi:hypothetical protein